MLNIVIPMAGLGSRFKNANYDHPKPLIPVHGVPMIKLVVDNLRPNEEHRFIFVCQKQHDDRSASFYAPSVGEYSRQLLER